MTLLPADAFHVDYPYRERRSYVHSASLCNDWAGRVPDASGFEIVLKHWMSHRVVFSPLAPGGVPGGSGHVAITQGDERRIYEITEDLSHPVAARVAYDEDAVPKTVNLEARLCTVPAAPGYTFFDRLISGNKALINEILNPGVKLIAAKIATQGFPADDAPITLHLKSNVGRRIFKSALSVDGVPYGEVIYLGA